MDHAVIMAGGSGTRFWPKSRARLPKQLLSLVTGQPLLVDTVVRLDGLFARERVRVITNSAYADASRALLDGVPARNVVAEPCGRDTAACIALAATLIDRDDPDAVVCVLPADHVVSPAADFRAAIARAIDVVRTRPDALLTFGVKPTRAATGYGYIERGDTLGSSRGVPFFRVASFREKPDAATAQRFVDSGQFSWNAGVFVFRARTMMHAIERHLPDLAAAVPAIADEWASTGSITQARYAELRKISIDYGVFEKERDVVVMEATFGWDDVGSFAALSRVLPHDSRGNAVVGSATVLDAKDNVVLSEPGHHVALLGVEGLVVVHTDDATLVCRRDDAERVKEIVAQLERGGHRELL
ncbi:MAG: NTP transferase domain-containing protein [Planctomycetes bacterium]|nr:NTP transferase domain-containing protein [Planctomycetota bacterium]MCC7173054.1 NTP transferase domain-containing protein [Planctomycetota bacterium]